VVAPDPGSYRDPLSRVYVAGDDVYRALSAEGLADYEALAATTLFTARQAGGTLVATERLAAAPDDIGLDPRGEPWAAVLRHERVPVISYPYEWTFSMLRDAALLQLALTREAMAADLITKDATPYNVQFRGAQATFIDVGSFERLRPGEPWYGYRQLCQLYLYPLMLQAFRDVPFQPWLRGSLDGIEPEECRRLLSRRDRMRRAAFAHVVVQARAERTVGTSDRDVKGELARAGFGPVVIANQVKNLTKVIEGLRWKAASSEWSGYSERGHYADDDLDAKTDFVRTAVGDRRRVVVDLGANDGRFSRVAAEAADLVVAVDADPLVVERLYVELRDGGVTGILPLTVDLVDPSPALGWRAKERRSFADRVQADLVLALALVHHLAITRTVPFDEVVGFLADLGGELVVELPDRDDPMVARLLRNKRDGLFDHYTLDAFRDALARRYDIATERSLPSGTRHLFHCTRRS
jgi:hypothetical protein